LSRAALAQTSPQPDDNPYLDEGDAPQDDAPPPEGPAASPAPATPPPAADADAAAVTPPSALDTRVSYPEGAHGDARVVLELTIAADGSIEQARAVQGSAPFVEAALVSAQAWRFVPARRGGQAVPARIRFEVRYVEERHQPAASEEPATSEESAPQAEPVEVVVRGQVPPGAKTVTRAEARELPGSFGDPTRAIEVMPGVTPVVSGVPMFFVRGAPPGNVGFFIDGVKVPMLYHAFLGPAVLSPAMISKVSLYPGGYPAQYGRFAGAIIELDLAPVDDELRAEGTLRLYDAGAFLSSPFADGRARALAGGRYSYTGLVLSLLTDAELEYWDYHALAEYDLTRKDTVSVFGFGSYEYYGDGKDDFFGTEFHRIDLRYDRALSKNSSVRIAMTFGRDRTRATRGLLKAESYAARSELRHRFSNEVLWRMGADVMLEGYEMDVSALNINADDIRRLFPTRTDFAAGAYTDAVLNPETWVEFTPGVRVDLFRSQGDQAVGVDPRLAARYHLTKTVDVIHTFGIAHQIPSYVPGVPGAVVGGLEGGLQESMQSSAGVEVELPDDFSASATVFQNAYFKLTDPISLSQNLALNADIAEERATGSARGLELQVKRSFTRRVGGVLSYTLSRSERSHGHVESVAGFDRPHMLTGAVSVDLGERWRVGAKGVFYSGVPGSHTSGEGPVFDRARGRPFFRLDLRAEKRFRLGERGFIAPFAEVLNATASSEIIRRRCGQENCDEASVGPILLPSLGVEAKY
jgi:TonB family protein